MEVVGDFYALRPTDQHCGDLQRDLSYRTCRFPQVRFNYALPIPKNIISRLGVQELAILFKDIQIQDNNLDVSQRTIKEVATYLEYINETLDYMFDALINHIKSRPDKKSAESSGNNKPTWKSCLCHDFQELHWQDIAAYQERLPKFVLEMMINGTAELIETENRFCVRKIQPTTQASESQKPDFIPKASVAEADKRVCDEHQNEQPATKAAQPPPSTMTSNIKPQEDCTDMETRQQLVNMLNVMREDLLDQRWRLDAENSRLRDGEAIYKSLYADFENLYLKKE